MEKIMNHPRTITIATLLFFGIFGLACRSPKKVLTEHDKQQVKDSLLPEPPTGPEIVPVNVLFEDKIKLLSYSVDKQQAKAGDTIAMTLYWECLAPVDGDFKIFVHLDSTKARKTFDHYAVGGLYPTANWKKGEIIKDEMALKLDAKFPGGPAKLWLGFFDASAWKEQQQNVRLSVKDPGSVRADKGDRLLVTAFMVGDVEEKKLQVKKVAKAPTIDGKLDEPAWQQALVSGGSFHMTDGKALPEGERVEAGILWDDTNVYFGFKVNDKDISTPYTTRDSTLWSGGKRGASDVMEIFFDPDADGKEYLELQVSPARTIFDAIFTRHRSPSWQEACKVNLAVEQAVVLDGTLNDATPDQGYVVEIAVPWKELPGMDGPPAAERLFRLNFFRLSNSGTWAAAWSPVGNDFHDMALAGRVTFVP
jgi:hypothetical protein